MNPRIVWPLAILFGLAILAFNFSGAVGLRVGQVNAYQDNPPRPAGPFMGGGTGRFVVAYASEARIVVLDTTTGQLYQALNEDFKKISDLPRIGGDPMQFKDKDRLRPFDKDKDRDRFSKDDNSKPRPVTLPDERRKDDGTKRDDTGKLKDGTGTAQ